MDLAMTKVKPQIPLQVYVSPEEHANLKAIAAEAHRSMSAQVRVLIAEACNARKVAA